ncbi:RNA polymerase sigma-70 factor [Brevibacillus daliensis]|uniref:RNA polymerase sigma-70 factor n=1 Tax=Brevibacillus daliensis TaxID=2892995 RepID=UPI001E3EE85B|nr:RNA polymerase sigma-70 factor [Brevibacillus daliensis]
MEDRQLSEIDTLYMEYKKFLFGLAYQMLGTISDAEDVIQDVYLRIQHYEPSQIRNAKAFLAKITLNRCLDQLRSTQKKRELYVGAWLPEPLLKDLTSNDPEETILQRENISYALLTLLEQLNPVERAVFLLREVFDFDYSDINTIVGKTPSNCRKIHSRAKEKLHHEEHLAKEPTETEYFVQMFIDAIQLGQIDNFVQLLTEDAVMYSDGGGRVKAAVRPIVSRKYIAQFIAGLLHKNKEYMEAAQIYPVQMNGETGLVIINGSQLVGFLALRITNNQIQEIYLILNPDKLAQVAKTLNVTVSV